MNNITDWHRGDWMQTYTGKKFYPFAPTPEDVDILDIAHSLSMQCRYNGHVDRFYSVAEHCVLMSVALERELIEAGDDRAQQLALEALLHDAAEAYVGDMVRPLKHSGEMNAYKRVEARVELAIAYHFGLMIDVHSDEDFPGQFQEVYVIPPEVKDADTRILLTERDALMPGKQPGDWLMEGMRPLDVAIRAWSPERAKEKYLERFADLT